MKKLFITLTVCLGLSALFTSCSAFFDIEFNSPAKLVISDEICEADVYIDIEVYEYNVSSNRRGNCVLSKNCVYLDRGSSKVYNIYNKLDFYSCYEVVINTSCSGQEFNIQKVQQAMITSTKIFLWLFQIQVTKWLL